MKRIVTLALALVFVLALFAGCGGNTTTTTTPGSTTTDTPSNNDTPSNPTEAPVVEGENLAAGKFAVDERGFATEKYDYTAPLTTSEDVYTFWTVIWVPEHVPGGDYGDIEYTRQTKERTGVNIEYVTVTSEARSQQFSVLLASDNLCDVSAGATALYPGTIDEAVYGEGYLVNIYDYRQYCPNYIYEVAVRNPDDKVTRSAAFFDETTIPSFVTLTTEPVISLSSAIRLDWLTKVGLTLDDIVTFDDFLDALRLFKSQIPSCDTPWGMLNVIDLAGNYTLNAFDTLPCVSSTALPPVYQMDGKVRFAHLNQEDYELMQMLNTAWNDGLIHPDWAGISDNSGYQAASYNNELGYLVTNATGCQDHSMNNIDPDADWEPMHKLLRYEGQTIHVGASLSRHNGYGSSSISTKCKNIPLMVAWCDWRYSDSGSFFVSYGPEGVTWNYDDEGNVQFTDYVLHNPDGIAMDWVLIVNTINQLAEHGLEDANRKYAYEGGQKYAAMNAVWLDFDHDDLYDWPNGLNLTAEQTNDVNTYSTDVCTYISENYLAFLDGSKPFDEWDSYVSNVMDIGMTEIMEIYQEAYDNFMAA